MTSSTVAESSVDRSNRTTPTNVSSIVTASLLTNRGNILLISLNIVIESDKLYMTFFVMNSSVVAESSIVLTNPTLKVRTSSTVADLLFKKTFWGTDDSASISDSITKRVFYGITDSVTVDELSAAKSKYNVADSITTSDLIFKNSFWNIEDSATIDDSITKRVFYTISDTSTIDDHASFKASIRTLHDSVSIADLGISVFFINVAPPDLATIDDSISMRVFIRLTDGARGESVTVVDLTSFKALSNMYDTASMDDSISKRILYTVTDSVDIDDHASFKASIRTLHDAVTVDDDISKKALYTVTDSLTISEPVIFSIFQTVTPPDITLIDDFISMKVFVRLTDGAKAESTTVDDSLLLKGAILIETRDENDNLIPGFNYTVFPNPFTGTGSLTVIDGGTGDNDTVNDGLIRVYYVPLDLYRINQTSVPAGNFSLYNFTYTTVHLTDINATALFRAVNSTTNLSLEAPIVADIVDIDVPPGFDDLISSSDLAKVRNGIQTPIIEVTDMPAPIFAGVSNASAIDEATAAQYSLVYENMNLTTNEAPDVIRDAFGLTQYDPGNSTDSTFVGIFTATIQNVTFGQYIATQPLDKFNCGQEYIFKLDNSLVPNFGGMTRAEFTLASNGLCPVAEDYNTFEIAPVPPAGFGVSSIPSDESILLYINAQYPAINGTGVDFSNKANIDSYELTLITRLPETGDINDLSAYVFNNGLSPVKIVSAELLSPNNPSSLVKVIISTDLLGKFVVTGKVLPPVDNKGVKSGFGNTGVGPTSKAKSKIGGELSGAKIHRVSYDVCTENISRILVGHDRPVPPLIQLVSPQLGLVEATLSEFQPYAKQSRDAEVSRYLYEAPLGSGDRYFSIFAVDHKANVGTAQIQVEGCQGTIYFVDDKVVLPQIFDVKYQIDNSTIRPDISEHHYIDEINNLPVSAIVDSPLVPLNRAELRILTLGEPEESVTVVPMNIEALHLPLDITNSTSIVSGIIPSHLIQGPAVEFWVYLVTVEGLVKESQHTIVAVRPTGYSGESSVEMDTTTIKAQGTTLRPTAYVINNAESSVYGDVSLLVDGKTVYTEGVLIEPGKNIIHLKWTIPKTDSTTRYDVQSQIEIYEDSVITSKAALNSYVRTLKMPVDGITESIRYVTDETGNSIARPALLYASSDAEGVQFRVTAPDGSCVIGGSSDCLVTDSTANRRGGLDSVIVDGQIYRVKYSGADNIFERFSITSLDSVAGDWKVEMVPENGLIPYAEAEAKTMLTIKYRAESGGFVRVISG